MRQAGEWKLDSLDPLRYEAASIYNRICPTRGPSLNDNFAVFKKSLEAVAQGSPHESAVLVEVIEKLPVIVERISAVPKSDVRELRKLQEFEVKALNAFIEACKLGISWASVCQLSPLLKSGEKDEGIASKVGSSTDWVKWARKEAASNCKPLESAMFIRFTQAYKGWELVDKAESSFWKKIGFKP
ncbi:hypothetical protein ACFLYF_02680 [Chloroflexota bacterium]